MPSSSAIKAYVDWQKSAVFAGEDIECIITFTNTAPAPARIGQDVVTSSEYESSSSSHGSPRVSSRVAAPKKTPSPKFTARPIFAQTLRKGTHRQTISLNLSENAHNGALSTRKVEITTNNDKNKQNHLRSLSITSMGIGNEKSPGSRKLSYTADSRQGHFRSASLQAGPVGSGGMSSLSWYSKRCLNG